MSLENKKPKDCCVDLSSLSSEKAFELCTKFCGLREGKNINIVSALLANIIAEKFSFAEIEILALFFNSLAEDLETIVDTSDIVCSNASSFTLPESVV